jgi:hypothetical protein
MWKTEVDRLRTQVEELLAEGAREHAELLRLQHELAKRDFQQAFLRNVDVASVTASRRQLSTQNWKASEVAGVDKRGILTKCNGPDDLLQNKRYFILTGTYLHYFKSQDDRIPRGTMFLTDCGLIPIQDTGFSIQLIDHDTATGQRGPIRYHLFVNNPQKPTNLNNLDKVRRQRDAPRRMDGRH